MVGRLSGGRWLVTTPDTGMFFLSYMPGEDKQRWVVGPIPVSPNAIARMTADTVVIGDTGTPDMQSFLPDGRLVRRMTIPLEGSADSSKV